VKPLWTALSIISFLHILALLALAGWLVASDRIDVQRIDDVRDLFTDTVTQRNARDAAAQAEAERQRAQDLETARAAEPPISAADVVAVRLEQSSADAARLEAIRREVEILQETIRRQRLALEEDRAEFERQRTQFEQARAQVERTEGTAQFRKALATYEALKPDRARLALRELIDQGDTDQVVAYLNAMQERTRTRIIDEFLRDDPRMATDLLERLRMRGIAARTD
jgi:hypothetical protein